MLQLAGGPSLTAHDTLATAFCAHQFIHLARMRIPIKRSQICLSFCLNFHCHIIDFFRQRHTSDKQWFSIAQLIPSGLYVDYFKRTWIKFTKKQNKSGLWSRAQGNGKNITLKNWIQRLSVFLRGVNSNNSMKSSSNLLMNYFVFKLSMSNSFE